MQLTTNNRSTLYERATQGGGSHHIPKNNFQLALDTNLNLFNGFRMQ